MFLLMDITWSIRPSKFLLGSEILFHICRVRSANRIRGVFFNLLAFLKSPEGSKLFEECHVKRFDRMTTILNPVDHYKSLNKRKT